MSKDLQKLGQDKEVQVTMLAEKYALADWNSTMKESESKGLAIGRAEGREIIINNLMAREGLSKEEATEKADSLHTVMQ